MGLFKSSEEKEQIKEEKAKKIMAKYELSEISEKYYNAVNNINSELAGSGLGELGNLLSPDANTASRIQIQMLNSIMQQNWIIIRQLDELNKKLEK